MAAGIKKKESITGAASLDTALRREKGEGTDGPLGVAQGFWGRGNLSPLDIVLSATALVKLVPTAGFGFVGRHVGQRLRKYADDTGAPVDAAEVDATLTRLYAKKKSSIRFVVWEDNLPVFKPGRCHAFVVLEAGGLQATLQAVYRSCAIGLKKGGKLFSADLMASRPGVAGQEFANTGASEFRSFDEHASSLQAAGLEIEARYDLTADFLNTIRGGFLQSLGVLEELRVSRDSDKLQRLSAFAAQLERWTTLYGLATAGKIEVIGMLAGKGR